MRRIVLISLLMAALLVATCGTSWASLTDIANNPHREAIENMVELGVLEGRGDGLFWPSASLTRAEAAKVAAYLAGFNLQDAESARSWPGTFTDVYAGMGAHEWAVGWINLVAKEKIILGYGDGNYHPGESLQMAQWVTILIRLLDREDTGMAWPDDYDARAHQLGLTDGLTYQSRVAVNRGEMARLSATAINDVERPDGTRILDTILAAQPGVPGEPGNAIFLTASVEPQLVLGGGGQVATITLTVTDSSGQPVVGAVGSLFAEAFETGSRNGQLSDRELVTDANGQIVSNYTTLAGDDNRLIGIQVHVGTEEAQVERRLEFLASNQATRVQGYVRHPATGNPVGGASVLFWHTSFERTIGVTEADANGFYSTVMPLGGHLVHFDVMGRDEILVELAVSGTTYTVNYDKGVLTGIVKGASPDTKIMAIPPNFNRYNPTNHTLQANVASDGSFTLLLAPATYELFVVGRNSPFKTGVKVESGRTTNMGTVSL